MGMGRVMNSLVAVMISSSWPRRRWLAISSRAAGSMIGAMLLAMKSLCQARSSAIGRPLRGASANRR